MPGMRRRTRRRTAAVVGTAAYVAGKNNNDEQSEAQAPAAAPAPTPVAATPAPAQDDMAAQLEQLNNLKNQGIITEEEFAAKKAQILGI